MKKIVAFLTWVAFAGACSPGSGTDKNSENTSAQIENSGTEKATGSLSQVAGLMAKSDCLTCHKEQEKLIGPAFADIAAKYSLTDENVDSLANKIIKGGSGVWGQIPMTPHPNISTQDAGEMAQYILSVKSKL